MKQGRESVPISVANHTAIEALQLSHIQKSRLVFLLETVKLESQKVMKKFLTFSNFSECGGVATVSIMKENDEFTN